MENITFREKQDTDNGWVKKVATEVWGSPQILSKGTMFEVASLSGFIADQLHSPIGVILYHIDQRACEIVAMYSGIEKQGIGTKLIELVKAVAVQRNCTRVWLQTTNDNTRSLRFYQKRGFTIVAIRTNVIDAQRKTKTIPLIGNDGIPIRDEIELELKI